MGFEGANVVFDTWVHPLLMGLEEHLLHMFRDDFEFNDAAAPSHLHGDGGGSRAPEARTPLGVPVAPALAPEAAGAPGSPADAVSADRGARGRPRRWSDEAERELGKIPFFVRGKARRNTETFARDRGLVEITLDTLYDAKAHHAR